MNSQSHSFFHDNNILEYNCIGTGDKIIFAFHGYGQTKEDLASLAKYFSSQYTVYCFDLFFHGKSVWSSQEVPISKKKLADLLSAFMDEKKIDRFSVLGFSMGAKFALNALEYFPENINEAYLIAPDGIKTNFWYYISTYPGIVRSLFKKTILQPVLYKSLVWLLEKIRVVDKSVLKFANAQMQTDDQRRRVYYSWTVFRQLRFKMSHISSNINIHNIRLVVFLGQYDRMITVKNTDRLTKRVKNAQIHILPTGHSKLIPAVAHFLINNRTQHEK